MKRNIVDTLCATLKMDNDVSFRVLLVQDPKSVGSWMTNVLVISRGALNPLDFAHESWEALDYFLEKQGLAIDSCQVFLELMEYLGIRTNSLFRWTKDNVVPTMPEDVQLLVDAYYGDKWSLLTESLLTNEEKVDLVVARLAKSVYDDAAITGLETSIAFGLRDQAKRFSPFS